MRFSRIFNARSITLLVILAILVGLLGTVLCSCVERLIYPREYRNEVEVYCEKYAVPTSLVFAVIKVESGFQSDAISSVGARGLMQLLPSTAEWLAATYLDEDPKAVNLFDPETNIKYGVYYLQYLFSRFGSWENAIIAYNWGEGNFKSFLESDGYIEGEYNSIPVRETRNYIKKVTRIQEIYSKIYK